MNDLRHLSDSEKLFRLGIGLKLVASETTDEETRQQLQNYIKQLGL